MSRLFKILFHPRHFIIVGLTLLLMVIIGKLSMNLSFLNPIVRAIENFSVTDMYYQIDKDTNQADSSQVITIVDISDIKDRKAIALMIDSIQEANPAEIAFDVIFDGLQGDPEGSDSIVRAVSDIPNATYAYMMENYSDSLRSFTNLKRSFFLFDDLKLEGYVNVPESSNGSVVRTFSLSRVFKGNTIKSFPLQIANKYDGKDRSANEPDRIINFSYTIFPVVKYNQIGQNTDLLSNRIVLIGAMHDIVDNHYTPLQRISGVELVAYTTQTLLEKSNPVQFSKFWTWVITILIIFITELWQYLFSRYVKTKKNLFCIYASKSTIIINVLTFFWMAFITYLNFIAFMKGYKTFNLLLPLMGIALVGVARDIEWAIRTFLIRKNKQKQLNKKS